MLIDIVFFDTLPFHLSFEMRLLYFAATPPSFSLMLRRHFAITPLLFSDYAALIFSYYAASAISFFRC